MSAGYKLPVPSKHKTLKRRHLDVVMTSKRHYITPHENILLILHIYIKKSCTSYNTFIEPYFQSDGIIYVTAKAGQQLLLRGKSFTVNKHLQFELSEVYWLHKLGRLNGNATSISTLGSTTTYIMEDFNKTSTRIQDEGLYQCVLGFNGMPNAPLVIKEFKVNIAGR